MPNPSFALEHFLIETLCVSIVTLPTLRGKSAVFPLADGAGVRFRVRQSDCHFQWHFALNLKETGFFPDKVGGNELAVRLVGAVGHLNTQGLYLIGPHIGGILGGAVRFCQQDGIL